MDDRPSTRRRTRWFALSAAALLAGCAADPPPDTHLRSPYPNVRVVAVAPFMNQSGSPNVDPLAVSDLFFAQLQMVRGLRVLPVNRSLQAMMALKMRTLSGPGDVLRLAEFLGADEVFVGAVTAYNPYDPPQVGLAVQVYVVAGAESWAAGGLDPVALGRAGRPLPIQSALPPGDPGRPRSQLNELYDASHEIVRKQVRDFAEVRGAGESPLGWQLYVKSITHFMEFCCHAAIRELLVLEQYRLMQAQARADVAADPKPASGSVP